MHIIMSRHGWHRRCLPIHICVESMKKNHEDDILDSCNMLSLLFSRIGNSGFMLTAGF